MFKLHFVKRSYWVDALKCYEVQLFFVIYVQTTLCEAQLLSGCVEVLWSTIILCNMNINIEYSSNVVTYNLHSSIKH